MILRNLKQVKKKITFEQLRKEIKKCCKPNQWSSTTVLDTLLLLTG